MPITFDSANKRIVLDTTYVVVGDIYSRWKEWVKDGNSEFLPAFRVVGGDPLGGGLFVASYFFLQNGWRIRPMESNHQLTIEGNIGVDGGGNPIVPTLGTFNVITQFTVPVAAQGIETGSGGGATASEVAAAVLAALQATTIPVNIKKVNDLVVDGTGTELDPWGPV